MNMKAAAALLGRQGGLARAAKLTREERQAIARKAVLTRWKRYRERKQLQQTG